MLGGGGLIWLDKMGADICVHGKLCGLWVVFSNLSSGTNLFRHKMSFFFENDDFVIDLVNTNVYIWLDDVNMVT